MRLLIALLLVLVPSIALAQYTEPENEPDPRYLDQYPELYRGFYAGGGFGISNPRGSFYRNRWKPGPAFKAEIGYRPIPWASAELVFQGGLNEIDLPGFSNAQITELGLGVRVFPLGATRLQPFVAVAALPMVMADAADLTLRGQSWSVEGGARLDFPKSKNPFFLSAGVRHSFIRWLSARDEVFGVSSKLPRQEHGDLVSVVVGGGARF